MLPTPACEGDDLHLSVRDDGPGLAANWDLERGAGVGLSNTLERLRRAADPKRPLPTVIFDERYTLDVGGSTL